MTRFRIQLITLLLSCQIFPANTATLLHEQVMHDDSIDGLCISGRYLYTASFDGKIKRTDFTTTEEIGRHTDWVRALLCTDDRLISASNDGRIIIWQDKVIVRQTQAHSWWITDLALYGNKIVSVSLDETVKIWSYPDLQLLFQHKIPGSYKHHSVTVFQDLAFIGSTRNIAILDLKTHQWPVQHLIVNKPDIYHVSAAGDNYIYFGDSAGNIYQLDPANMQFRHSLSLGRYAIKAMAYHDHSLYVGNDAGHLYRIDVPGLQRPELIHRHAQAIRSIKVVNNIMYAAFDQGVVRSYHLQE